jgi:hypothetical protein
VVTAVVRRANHPDLFPVGADHRVYMAACQPETAPKRQEAWLAGIDDAVAIHATAGSPVPFANPQGLATGYRWSLD